MKSSFKLAVPFALICLAVSALTAPASAAPKFKPKDGAYYQSTKQAEGYIAVVKGKVAYAQLSMKFKQPDGSLCEPESITVVDGMASFSLDAKKPIKPNRRKAFSYKAVKNSAYPGVTGKVTGRFLNKNKARFSVVAKASGCTAKFNFKKAKFGLG